MKTIAHTRGLIETADVIADSIEALDAALRGNSLQARLELPVTAGGVPLTVEIVLGRRQVVTTERSGGARPLEADGESPFQFDWL